MKGGRTKRKKFPQHLLTADTGATNITKVKGKHNIYIELSSKYKIKINLEIERKKEKL